MFCNVTFTPLPNICVLQGAPLRLDTQHCDTQNNNIMRSVLFTLRFVVQNIVMLGVVVPFKMYFILFLIYQIGKKCRYIEKRVAHIKALPGMHFSQIKLYCLFTTVSYTRKLWITMAAGVFFRLYIRQSSRLYPLSKATLTRSTKRVQFCSSVRFQI